MRRDDKGSQRCEQQCVAVGWCSLDRQRANGARGTGNDTVQYAVRVDPSVITLPPVAVPTISPWGTGALALLLGAAGIMIRRRRHT